jgi:hypothetical protein
MSVGTWWLVLLGIAAEPSAEPSALLPFPHERVEPVALGGACRNLAIVEAQGGMPSRPKREIMSAVCNLVVLRFRPFLKSRKVRVPAKLELSATLSLLDPGTEKRQLNDPARFANLKLEKPDGSPITKYGYYHFDTRHIFLLNDVGGARGVKPFFLRVFAHEVFHALTHQNDILDSLPHPSFDTDERLAREFTVSLGLGE